METKGKILVHVLCMLVITCGLLNSQLHMYMYVHVHTVCGNFHILLIRPATFVLQKLLMELHTRVDQ